MNETFGDKAANFSYSEKGNLRYNGDTKGLTKDQKKLLKGLSSIMNDKTTTHLVYGSETEITMTDGTKHTVKASDGGGAVTILVGENKVSENTVLIDPDNAQIKTEMTDVYTVNDAYYKTPIDPANGPRFVKKNYKNNVSSATFHEFGHVIYKGKTQDNVIDYENNARRLFKLEERAYDETHNSTVKKGQYGGN